MSLDLTRCEWKKSTASGDNNACVEVAMTSCTVGVRDTKSRADGHLEVPTPAWSALVNALHA
jgi:hypothetical protein